MTLSYTILGLFALVPILALSLPFSLDSYLHSLNLSASSLNIARTLSQSCSVSSIPVPLGDQMTLAISDDEVSSMIAAGRGIQNYTCISGAYVSTGALANLFDVTCLYALTAGKIDPSIISSILPKMAFVALEYPNTDDLSVTIHHLFVDTPGSISAGSISPEFVTDTDRVLVSKTATLDDPYNAAINVPWLKLVGVEGQGTYAKSVFRINTFQGQPPSLCTTENEKISVQYASMYWFTK
ncbi:hypothetical protein C356_06875 [Cryptococcus neoformans c45]|nr:hypothetical protein C356_06875 [Cryptococcus neoformans var. grubii c45]